MSKANILVVEDERITAEDIKTGLVFAGYSVPCICASGEDAVQKAGKHQPDLVLMDIKLEGQMDGIEAAGEIRRLYDIPVIYLTAYTDEKTIERAKKTEPSGYLVKGHGIINKPFEESELHAAIEITLYRHQMEKEHDQLCSAMLRNVSEAVISTDSDRVIKFMNAAAEGLTNLPKEEALNKNLTDVFLEFKEPILGEMSLDEAIISAEGAVLKNRDNTNVILEGTITPLKDSKETITGYVIIFKPKP